MDAGQQAAGVEMTGISKVFGGIRALDDVSFSVRAGEVHALLGENGAGKSTLMKILAGAHQATTGEIRIGGERVSVSSPHDVARPRHRHSSTRSWLWPRI